MPISLSHLQRVRVTIKLSEGPWNWKTFKGDCPLQRRESEVVLYSKELGMIDLEKTPTVQENRQYLVSKE